MLSEQEIRDLVEEIDSKIEQLEFEHGKRVLEAKREWQAIVRGEKKVAFCGTRLGSLESIMNAPGCPEASSLRNLKKTLLFVLGEGGLPTKIL